MREDLREVLLNVLEVDSISEADSAETIANWDSVRHLSLVMALEERFGVTFDANEIPDLVSVARIQAALSPKTRDSTLNSRFFGGHEIGN
jgi:acyl carrier protein